MAPGQDYSPGGRNRTRLRFDTLEDRTTPAYLQNGGINLAVGDVLPGGQNEIVTGPGVGGGPVVRIYNIAAQQVSAFSAFPDSARFGVAVATGDLDLNGSAEVVATPGPGGGPIIRVFDYFGNLLNQFNAFDPSFRGGLSVAVGDVDGDGVGDIVVTPGPGSGGGPVVRVFSMDGTLKSQFMAYDPSFRGGLTVATGNASGQTFDDIIVGVGPGGGPLINIFNMTGQTYGQFFAYDPNDRSGVNVASGDTDFNGRDEIWTAPMPGGGKQVRAFIFGVVPGDFIRVSDYDGTRERGDPNYNGGINLAVGDVTGDFVEDVLSAMATGDLTQQPEIVPGHVGTVALGAGPFSQTGFYTEDNNFVYYFPSRYSENQIAPIMFAFDATGQSRLDQNGQPQGPYLTFLRPLADRFGIILAVSKYFHSSLYGPLRDGGTLEMNYDASGNLYAGSGYISQLQQIKDTLVKFTNVNPTRVYYYGFAEGASFAHAMNFVDPSIADLIVADQGTIYGAGAGGSGPDFAGYAQANAATIISQSAFTRRTALFFVNDADTATLNTMFFRDIPLYNMLQYDIGGPNRPTTTAVGQPYSIVTYIQFFNLIYNNLGFANFRQPP